MNTTTNGFAESALDELTSPLEDFLDQPPTDGGDVDDEQRASIFVKIRFAWRPEDEDILQRIRAAVDEELRTNFSAAMGILDTFYCSMRIPLTLDSGGPVTDARGRVLWELDGHGHPKESVSQLTGQDLEQAILGLEKMRLDVAPRISWLLSEAIYAKHVAGDIHDDTYWSTVDGTVADRTARANRENRQDRYHAFFRYSLWLASKEFLDEVGRFMTYLDKIRTWRSFER